jgi:hypothetical protein
MSVGNFPNTMAVVYGGFGLSGKVISFDTPQDFELKSIKIIVCKEATRHLIFLLLLSSLLHSALYHNISVPKISTKSLHPHLEKDSNCQSNPFQALDDVWMYDLSTLSPVDSSTCSQCGWLSNLSLRWAVFSADSWDK